MFDSAPKMAELHAAWELVNAVTPPGWFVGRPSYDPTRRQWVVYAYDPFEKPVGGHRLREWTALGMTELGALEEMARCLGELQQGRVPR